jgi:hypothetical protein
MRFAQFESGDFDGITYLDTFFLKKCRATDERLYFHELIHIVQWSLLGPKRFLATYADGLEKYGYRDSPLEIMTRHIRNLPIDLLKTILSLILAPD